LLKRFATPDEDAAMVTYLASELSSATNGAAIRTDGGVVSNPVGSANSGGQLRHNAKVKSSFGIAHDGVRLICPLCMTAISTLCGYTRSDLQGSYKSQF
jgi:hypothetical protein